MSNFSDSITESLPIIRGDIDHISKPTFRINIVEHYSGSGLAGRFSAGAYYAKVEGLFECGNHLRVVNDEKTLFVIDYWLVKIR